jgi:hypothetical protein
MTEEIRLTIVPRSSETRILMTQGPDDVLMARLAPVTAAHPRWAAPTLLQALATWQGCPVRVVLSADAEDYFYGLGLSEGLGLGDHTLHYVVDVVDPRARYPVATGPNSQSRTRRGVLPVEGVQLLVEGGVGATQLERSAEEGLGDHGEELGRAGGAVPVDGRRVSFSDRLREPVVFGAEHPRPGAVHRARR